jgi:hypothetical protein
MGKNDFFGDGRSDIILQNTDGSVVLWEMSGTAIVNAGLVGNPGASWSVEATASGTAITPGSGSFTDSSGNVFTVSTAGLAEENGSPLPLGSGTAKLVYYDGIVYGQDVATGNWNILDGDGHWSRSFGPGFFGDGSSSIVMQNADGSVVLWDMSGTTIVNAGNVGNPGPTWHVEGTGVFFGDGNTAIIMQNDDGSVVLWDMSGPTIINAGLVGAPGPTWHVEGTGDFFGDGNTDLVMQNTDGSVVLWDVSGTTIVDAGLVAGPSTWQVKGTGDFFGDGNTDLVMQNTDGSVVLWDMSGTTIVNAGNVGNPGPTWHVKGTGDFFGDGHTDLVMQNADGSVVLWDMSGSHIINAGNVGNPGATWNVLDNNMRFIYGTSANETLAATPAATDEFVLTGLTTGSDTISGFNPAQDMIEFSKAQFASFTDVQAATSAISGGAMINLPNGSSLLLPGVDAGSLHASNFALA